MTADHLIEKMREENTALAADRDAWIEAANAQMKRARAAEAERDALRKANQKLHRRAQVFEGAFQAADHELALWEPTLAHHKLSQHDLLVRHIKAGLDKSFRRARTLAGDNHE